MQPPNATAQTLQTANVHISSYDRLIATVANVRIASVCHVLRCKKQWGKSLRRSELLNKYRGFSHGESGYKTPMYAAGCLSALGGYVWLLLVGVAACGETLRDGAGVARSKSACNGGVYASSAQRCLASATTVWSWGVSSPA